MTTRDRSTNRRLATTMSDADSSSSDDDNVPLTSLVNGKSKLKPKPKPTITKQSTSKKPGRMDTRMSTSKKPGRMDTRSSKKDDKKDKKEKAWEKKQQALKKRKTNPALEMLTDPRVPSPIRPGESMPFLPTKPFTAQQKVQYSDVEQRLTENHGRQLQQAELQDSLRLDLTFAVAASTTAVTTASMSAATPTTASMAAATPPPSTATAKSTSRVATTTGRMPSAAAPPPTTATASSTSTAATTTASTSAAAPPPTTATASSTSTAATTTGRMPSAAAESAIAPPTTTATGAAVTSTSTAATSTGSTAAAASATIRSISNRSLLQTIDEGVSKLFCRRWKAALHFRAYQCLRGEPVPSSGIPSASYVECDLFEMVNSLLRGSGSIARFDSSEYPVDAGGMKANKKSWNNLSSALMRACQKQGKFRLTSNGAHGKDQMALYCSHFKFYTANENVKKAEGKYRNHTVNCDKKNNRKAGKNQKKKTSTSRPVKGSEESTCKVKLVIGIDQYNFFLICGVGEETHEWHPPLVEEEMPTRLRTIPKEALTMARLMANNSVRPGSIAGVLEDSHGIKLTRRQVAWTTQMAKLAKDLIGSDNFETNKDSMSDLDRVMAYLRSIDASFVALYHRKGDWDSEMGRKKKRKTKDATARGAPKDILIVESSSQSGEVERNEVGETGERGCNKDVFKYAADTRVVVGATDDQDVLVALVWTTPEGKRFFQAFPEQVSLDGTHKTTNEDWEMITLSVQDMIGKQEVAIRCWAPNNRAWLFRWLFQTAIPSLVGRSACERVRLVITDGDSQECSQMDAAIELMFKHAKRRRCGWHIVDRGWLRMVGSFRGRADLNRKEIDDLVNIIKGWLYSLMKEIETVHEYKV
jgi:hypothetical protein